LIGRPLSQHPSVTIKGQRTCCLK